MEIIIIGVAIPLKQGLIFNPKRGKGKTMKTVAIPLKQGLIFNKGIRLIRAVNGSQSL